MTVREAFSLARAKLSPFEARTLMQELFGLDRLALLEKAACVFPKESEEVLSDALCQREKGMPLQYILGRWTFMGHEFCVGQGVLIPRDDTEVAVERCLEMLKGNTDAKIIDLCSGSGIIAITLALAFPKAEITAVEKEEAAFSYLEKNIRRYALTNVRAVCGDIFDCHKYFDNGYFDAVVSNPPYIREEELASLQTEVQFEPKTALCGGEDGLMFYRCIAECWTDKLKSGGCMVLEIGETQADAVTFLMEHSNMEKIRTHKDIQELDRVISCTKK